MTGTGDPSVDPTVTPQAPVEGGYPDTGAIRVPRTVIRVAGGVVATILAAITALIEIFYTPLRLGEYLIGVSAVMAVLVNFWLLRFTVAVTGAAWTGLLPAVVWFGLMMAASDRSDEGDVLLAADNWVALVTIFAGSLSFAAAGYRVINQPYRGPVPPVGAVPPVRPVRPDRSDPQDGAVR